MSDAIKLPSVAGAVLRGSLAQNRLRLTLATLAITLGVALGFAVQLINESAVSELAQGVHTLSGAADLEVRGPRGGFDEALYPVLARWHGVVAASPVVEVAAKIAGRDDALRIVGIDVFRASVVEPALVPPLGERLDALRSDTIFLTPAASRWLDASEGATLNAQSGLADVPLRVGGTLAAGDAQRFAVMDISGVQTAFGRIGRLSRVDLRVAPGADVDALIAELGAHLPPGVGASRPEANAAAGASLSRSYRVNLQVLALVALFTGSLLVFSTQALAVVRRRTQFALLRVLGMTRRQLVALIVTEGALIGTCGSALGVALGFVLAGVAVRAFGVDLGSGYFRGMMPMFHADALTLFAYFALGVAASVLGSLIPAIEAARAPPASALKAGDEERVFERLRSPLPGLVALVLGAAATALPPISGLPIAGYGAIALLLVGTLMLLPRLAAVALAGLPSPRAAAPRLALAQLAGAPGQLTVSLAAIVAAVSLMVSMTIMVASFRNSFEAWLERVLPADVYVRAASGGDTAFLPPETQARIAALHGLKRADFQREQQIALDSDRTRVVLIARPVDLADPARSLPLLGASLPVHDAGPPPVWVNEAAADLYRFAPGQEASLPLEGRAVPVTIAGVWRDYARPQGAIVMDRSRYESLTGDATVTNGALWLAPGADRSRVLAALRDIPGGDKLDIYLPSEIRAFSLRAFDRTFAVTYALEAAAVAIGLVGLSSSFGALVLARRREFGVLRHLGMTRRQVGAMLATEGAVASGIGLVVGLALGFAMSLILIRVVNRQSFHWGMEVTLPWGALAAFVTTVLVLSTLTALASGRRAMGADVIGAVKEDW